MAFRAVCRVAIGTSDAVLEMIAAEEIDVLLIAAVAGQASLRDLF